MASFAERPLGRILEPSPSVWVTATITSVGFLVLLHSSALAPFLPAMAADLGTSVALLGQVPALAALASALLALVVGPLTDSIGLRRTLCLSLAGLALTMLITGAAPYYLVLLFAALLGGLGRAAPNPVALVVAGTRYPEARQRGAVSWIMVGQSASAVVGVPLLTLLAGPLGWRGTMIALGVATAAVALLAYRSLGGDTRLGSARISLAGVLSAYPPLLRHRPTLGLISSELLGNVGIWMVATYVGAFYVQQHGYSVQDVGWVFLVAGLAAIVGSWAAAGRLGSLPARPLVIVTKLLSGLGVGGAFLLPIPALATVGLFSLHGAAIMVMGVMMALLLARESPAGKTTTMTLWGAVQGFGAAIGGALGGLLLAVGGYSLVGLAALVLIVAAAALVWWSRPTQSPRE